MESRKNWVYSHLLLRELRFSVLPPYCRLDARGRQKTHNPEGWAESISRSFLCPKGCTSVGLVPEKIPAQYKYKESTWKITEKEMTCSGSDLFHLQMSELLWRCPRFNIFHCRSWRAIFIPIFAFLRNAYLSCMVSPLFWPTPRMLELAVDRVVYRFRLSAILASFGLFRHYMGLLKCRYSGCIGRNTEIEGWTISVSVLQQKTCNGRPLAGALLWLPIYWVGFPQL